MTAARPLIHAVVFEDTFALGDLNLLEEVLGTEDLDPGLAWTNNLTAGIL